MIIINFTFFYEYIKVRDPVHHRETLASLCPLIGQRHQETAIGLEVEIIRNAAIAIA